MRLKTLNGAPFSQHLDFSEHSLLALDQCHGFVAVNDTPVSSSDQTALKWRCLASEETRWRTGWSQPYLPGNGLGLDGTDVSIAVPDVEQASTLFTPDATWLETTMDLEEPATAADDFLHHSLIFHDSLLSSQIVNDTMADQTISSSSFLTTSFGTTPSDVSSSSRIDGQNLKLQVAPRMTITPLGSFPSAQHLNSIYPQTPTPNALCVLMSPPERREVLVRKGRFMMNLYELIVGDDTRSGFKVTFWLRPPRGSAIEQSAIQQSLVRTLQGIKVGDTLLLRNIALTSYLGTVYGQSLNTAITRARTTIDVLMKSNGVSVGQLGGLPAAVLETFIRIKKWARAHVASNENGSRKKRGTPSKREDVGKRQPISSAYDESLPPDTMEAV